VPRSPRLDARSGALATIRPATSSYVGAGDRIEQFASGRRLRKQYIESDLPDLSLHAVVVVRGVRD
jgi:hypothetical protein